jgi:thiamine kinase-like enzyme
LDQGVDASEVATIESFVESTVARLNRQRDRQVDLVFSHGDFSLRNILKTAEGIKVIDWESVSLRSMLFDLYNCFLTELYYGRANTDLVSEIDEAIVSLQSRLALRAPEVAKALPSLAQTYRWLFYFERIQMLLERDPGDSLLKTILRSIDVFNRHEEAVTSA